MPPARWTITPARQPPPRAWAAAATLAAAAVVAVLPGGPDRASLWAVLVMLFPASAASAFALACACSIGSVAGLAAHAAGRRDVARPALTAAIATALLSPPGLAIPLWPALLAAAALVALPDPVRRQAANDNPVPTDRPINPFALAA